MAAGSEYTSAHGASGMATIPAIVLDAQRRDAVIQWTWIGPMLAANGHLVVAYDRPGMGWSTGPDQPRDAMSAANALEKAAYRRQHQAPYTVVGHSFGGFTARAFTGLISDQVTGLVLLNSTDPDGGGGPGLRPRRPTHRVASLLRADC